MTKISQAVEAQDKEFRVELWQKCAPRYAGATNDILALLHARDQVIIAAVVEEIKDIGGYTCDAVATLKASIR